MTAAHYKGGHHPGNDLGLHYTALPPIVASCPYSDQLLVTRKFWSPGANRPSQAKHAYRMTKQEDDIGLLQFCSARLLAVRSETRTFGERITGVAALIHPTLLPTKLLNGFNDRTAYFRTVYDAK